MGRKYLASLLAVAMFAAGAALGHKYRKHY